jgi:hypothetical protein
MADINSNSVDRRRATLRAAWVVYIILLTVPLAGLLLLLVSYIGSDVPVRTGLHLNGWFVLTFVWLAVGVPAALFFRRHLCGDYVRGKVVPRGKYFAGMLTVWLTLEVGMILSLIGCYVTELFVPNLALALVAFVFFVTHWPSGTMLFSRGGDSDDSEVYRQPR